MNLAGHALARRLVRPAARRRRIRLQQFDPGSHPGAGDVDRAPAVSGRAARRAVEGPPGRTPRRRGPPGRGARFRDRRGPWQAVPFATCTGPRCRRLARRPTCSARCPGSALGVQSDPTAVVQAVAHRVGGRSGVDRALAVRTPPSDRRRTPGALPPTGSPRKAGRTLVNESVDQDARTKGVAGLAHRARQGRRRTGRRRQRAGDRAAVPRATCCSKAYQEWPRRCWSARWPRRCSWSSSACSSPRT